MYMFVLEKDPQAALTGVIGFQLPSDGNAKVEFRDIIITELN